MDEEREREIMDMFWSETNDEETQEWRYELTLEEMSFVDELDNEISGVFSNLITEMSKAINS